MGYNSNMASPEYESYYAVIRAIPPGRVMTYGDVAAYAGRPRQARRVGYALAVVNDPAVPWWRVINAKGEISLRTPDGGSELMQRDLLELEGVEFTLERRVDLNRYRHRPHTAAGDEFQ
jgi:methylated-DNA-protein-cysteine methyltransferase-like protein